MTEAWNGPLEKVDDFRWRIPTSYAKGMRVPGLIYADAEMLKQVRKDQAPQQVSNVAHLPGVLGYAMAMPDIHWGYGFPIGGVAGVDVEEGVISPGGVGYDINCGVRLIRTNLTYPDIKDRLSLLVERLFHNIPCGVGSTSKLKLSSKEERAVLREGPLWAVKQGFGWREDVEHTEQKGCIENADPDALSDRAIQRGHNQLGTLGAGNHFIEIQRVEEIFDEEAAKAFGLEKGRITVMIHTGSRGLGYQVCDDNLDRMVRAMSRYKIMIPDKQLACAPVHSPEGKQYFAGMAASANYAWTNRQMILHWVRESFEQVLGQSAEKLGMHMIYDVAHNIAKFEEHVVDGQKRKVVVHRKGATRAFAAGHPDLPEKYQSVGQPVLIPGDMGTASYVLVGTQRAMEQSFGSTCHGAGRVMSRNAAIRATRGRSIQRELENQGIIVRSRGRKTLDEEMPEAYKDINKVVEIVHRAGLSKKVAKMKPLGVIKG
ncbi:RtcB family protein [bacterium]|nr:RtcB family protein [bacterium]RQV94729.1 MAG: RtcB family protein [bacterium]